MHKTFTDKGFSKAIEIINAIKLLGGKATIGECYMDYGAGITWETILVQDKDLNMSYQALSPRDFDEINEGNLRLERIKEIVAMATKGGN